MTNASGPFGGMDMSRLLQHVQPANISVPDYSLSPEVLKEMEEKQEREARNADHFEITALVLQQLNERQEKLNERQRIDERAHRRISRMQARAIRRYNIATMWLASIAAVGTGFAIAEIGRTFGWW